MKRDDIKRHLKDYSIYTKRKTTIVHAFASALSIADEYDDNKMREALLLLGQNPDSDLTCVYCERPAETWDHILALVKDSRYSGHGHQIANLVPCCKDCNSKKGNRNWREFLASKRSNAEERNKIEQRIEAYMSNTEHKYEELLDSSVSSEIEKLTALQNEVLVKLQEADKQATVIRELLKDKIRNRSNQ